MVCHWGPEGRAVKHRHIAEHQHADDCGGCLPCPWPHCRACGARHAENICPTCLHDVREDLAELGRLEQWVELTALLNGPLGEHEGGLPLGGEPMVMLGPIAPFSDDDEPMPPPAVVLIGWEYAIRHLLEQPTDLKPTTARAIDYIDAHLEEASATGRLDVGLLVEMVRSARAHLEDVVHAGLRDAAGVPCVRCGTALVRICHPVKLDAKGRHYGGGLADEWTCRTCRAQLTPAEYRYAVGVAYLHNAPALTAAEIEQRLGVKASVVRVWGSRGLVKKRGRTAEGLIQYDVEQVRARLEREQADTPGVAD